MTSDTIINPITQQEGSETESVTTTGATDHRSPEMEHTEVPPISLNCIFEILQNQRRRRVLWYLSEQGGAVSLRGLSEYVAALENDKSVAELTSQERKRVYVGLYQCHLPKMDDMGFIEYNKARGIIELGPQAVHTEKYLKQAESSAYPWPTYYLGLVGVGWLLLLGSLVVSSLATIVAVGVFLMLPTTLSLAHTYSLLRETAGPSFDSPA